MKLSISKMHGSKNTFYVLDIHSLDELPYVELTKWLCDKNNNGGADGLLLVLPSNDAQAKMRVINADGSEASMCGNGLRCVARYVLERDQLQETTIETMKATLKVGKEDGVLQGIDHYSVEINPISFDLSTLPMSYDDKQVIKNEVLDVFSKDITFTAVSVPNPHLVGIVPANYIQHIAHQKLLSQYLNSENQITPDGVNVSYVYPISDDEIFVRTFERGVGFTNACGTAMTASALVSYMNGYVKKSIITVHNPGGFVQCHVLPKADGHFELKLVGNATYVQHNELQITQGDFSFLSINEDAEDSHYQTHIQPVIEATKQKIVS
jgi:diaminopimelate epimerase